MKIICNSLYKPLLSETFHSMAEYWDDSDFINCKISNDADAIISQPYLISNELLSHFPVLKWIQLTSAGYDNVDLKYIEEHNIIITNTRGVMNISIAEDIMTKMMYFSRCIKKIIHNMQEKKWDDFNQNPWMCQCYTDLYGKNLGILGYGAIGTELAKRAKAFEMNIYAYSKTVKELPYADRILTGQDGLCEILKTCDYIVVALPLNNATFHLLSDDSFKIMKQSAILINIARGPIVDEQALYNALITKQIAGAALDVFEEEPLPKSSNLWELKQVLITPHKAGMGDSWQGLLSRLLETNINHFKNNEKPVNVIHL